MVLHIGRVLEEASEKFSDKVAFSDVKTSLSFSELEQISKRVGSFLASKNLLNEPIVVFTEKTPLALAGFFGVNYSGNFYVPLDRDVPKHRVREIFSSLKPQVVLVDDSCRNLVEGLVQEVGIDGDDLIYSIDSLLEYKIEHEKLRLISNRILDVNPMYMIFTSGTTGVPKGIVVNHRSVMDYVEQISHVLQVSGDTIFGNQAPLSVDACLKEVLSTLKYGCTTYFIPKMNFMFPVKLLEFLNEYKINTISWVSTALHIVASSGALGVCPLNSLKLVAFGSEIFHLDMFKLWKKALPEGKFLHLYGPTEATGMSAFYNVSDGDEFEKWGKIPIGQAFPNSEILLLDADLNLIQESFVSGEMYIRGTCLSMGYYANIPNTEGVFVQNPRVSAYKDLIYKTGDLGEYNENMDLMFISRIDAQIKHMGYRLELTEIEMIVNRMEGVLVSCGVYLKEEVKILVFYTGDVNPKDLMTYMKKEVPKYMLPREFFQLDEMPLLSNGKINRANLEQDYSLWLLNEK